MPFRVYVSGLINLMVVSNFLNDVLEWAVTYKRGTKDNNTNKGPQYNIV